MIMAGPLDKLFDQARRMGEDVQRAAQDLARESAAVMVVSAGLSAALAVGLTLLAHLGR